MMAYRYQILLFITIIIGGCGATTGQLTKEEQVQEDLRVKSIIESRAPNSDAISLAPSKAPIQKTGEYFWREETCKYKITIPASGNIRILDKPSGTYGVCSKLDLYTLSSKLNILPALKDGIEVDSDALVVLKTKKYKSGYSPYALLYLDSFSTLKVADASNPIDDVQLPKTNIYFDVIDNLKPVSLRRDEFETTKEFQDRVQRAKKASAKSVVLNYELSMGYDPDTETFSASSYCGSYSKNLDQKILKDNTRYENQSGSNGFGAPWSWTKQSGSKYFLKWSCANYDAIPRVKMKISDARREKGNIIAIVQLELEAKSWNRSSDYKRAEYGTSYSRDIDEYTKIARVKKFFVGNKESGEVYAVHDFIKPFKSKVSGSSDMAKSIIAKDIEYIPVYVPQPQYPRRSQVRGQSGYAKVQFTITTAGGVKNLVLIEEYPEGWGFGRSAIKAARKLKYNPEILDGVAVEVPDVSYKFSFEMAK